MSNADTYTEFDKALAEAMAETGESMPQGSVRIASGNGVAALGRQPQTQKDYDPTKVPEGKLFNYAEEVPERFARTYRSEKYEHRIIAYLKAQGHSNREIAELSGYSGRSICDILRLPWVQQAIIEEIQTAGRDAVFEVLRSASLKSAQYLDSVVDNEKLAARERISAAEKILNRVYGMPNQPITHSKQEDVASLTDAQLEEIAARGQGAI